VWDEAGREETLMLVGPEGYTMTADASIRATLALLKGQSPVGAQTPSKGLGAEFVKTLDGVSIQSS